MTAITTGSPLTRAGISYSSVTVGAVMPDSPAARAGLMPGDVITHVDGKPVSDFLDFYVASFGRSYTLTTVRDGAERSVNLEREPREETGIQVATGPPTPCNNKCIFCFIDQLPPNLREELYVKDGDYRLSFLHGNYVTLTNLSPDDEQRIITMPLSPLYVSVHATDERVRAALLGRKHRESIGSILDRLGAGGIRFHTQIVVVPGYNDGETLKQTLKDLCDRHEIILSVSVVPVGLTCYRQGLEPLERVSSATARLIVRATRELNTRMRQTIGRGFAYASDELVLISGSPIPPASYYDDYPQLENGVGLLRKLVDSTRDLEVPRAVAGKHLLLVTGQLAAPYIEEMASMLRDRGVHAEVVPVENALFGPTVTVSGLLSGRDIMGAVLKLSRRDAVVLPPNVANVDGITLDDTAVSQIANALGMPVVVGDYDLKQTMKRLDVVFSTE